MAKKFTEDTKEAILKALKDRGALRPCPRCGSNKLLLLDGYFIHGVQHDLDNISIGGTPLLPAVTVGCSNCGFLSQHALGALGLMPKEVEDKKKESEANESITPKAE